MFKRALNWGYERFKQSDLSRSPLAIRVARRARDAIFTVMVWKDGDAGERIVETDVLDHQLYVDLEDSGVSRTLYLNGVYEPELTRACSSIAEPGMTVVDVGANIGYFTVLFSEIVGEHGSVYAFEADPRNVALLERNVDASGCDNVTVTQVAVSDTSGTIEFDMSDDQFSRSSIVDPSETKGTIEEIDTVTLDDTVTEPVDLLKVDVVGAELRVLQGALSLIGEQQPRIVLPHLPEKWSDEELSVFDDLSAMGYSRQSLDGEPLGWPTETTDDRREPTQNVVLEPPP